MDSNYTKSSLLPVNPLREWRTSRICKKPEIDLVGYSRSADTTFFFLPQLKIGLDAGECRGRNPPFVFLTHTHADHSRALPWLLSKDGGMDCYCPASTIPFVKRYAQAEFELNCVSSNVESAPYRLHGVVGGDKFRSGRGNKLLVEVVDCFHSVPCVGFLFSEKRTKLKDEYRGKKGKELAALQKEGVIVQQESFVPLFTYLGDTSIEIFEKYPQIFSYPTIIVECTFLKHESFVDERCQRDGHIAWKHLEPYVLSHPECTFVLIHFSCRYKAPDIFAFFDELTTRKENPLDLKNVIVHANDQSEGKHSKPDG